jgi:hypothetical protein
VSRQLLPNDNEMMIRLGAISDVTDDLIDATAVSGPWKLGAHYAASAASVDPRSCTTLEAAAHHVRTI